MLNEIEEIFVQNLLKKMSDRGWKPKDLAKSTGLSLSGVYKILHAERWPNPDNILRIKKAFKCSAQSLFEAAPAAQPPSQADPAPLRDLLVAITRLNEDQLGILLDAASELIALNERPLDRLHKPKNAG